jgi:hypothetical protein
MVKIHWFDGLDSWQPTPWRGVAPSSASGETRYGQPTVESAIAHHPGTQGAVLSRGTMILNRARRLNTSARLNDPGFDRGRRTFVFGETKDPDFLVHLGVDVSVDSGVPGMTGGDPTAAAISVEYGHIGSGRGAYQFQAKGRRYEGKFILHRAAGLQPSKGVW